MSKKFITPKWTTTVYPNEYDYIGQFSETVKWANRNEAWLVTVDLGKVWGLVQSHERLERENAALRAVLLEAADALESEIESERKAMWYKIRAAIDAARGKEVYP